MPELWTVRVRFWIAGTREIGADMRHALQRHLQRFPGAEFAFDALAKEGTVDVLVASSCCRPRVLCVDDAGCIATEIVTDIAHSVLWSSDPSIRVSTRAEKTEECVDINVYYWQNVDDQLTDSERHQFLKRRGAFDHQNAPGDGLNKIERWHSDDDVKMALEFGG